VRFVTVCVRTFSTKKVLTYFCFVGSESGKSFVPDLWLCFVVPQSSIYWCIGLTKGVELEQSMCGPPNFVHGRTMDMSQTSYVGYTFSKS
jgi:hypothetical protein